MFLQAKQIWGRGDRFKINIRWNEKNTLKFNHREHREHRDILLQGDSTQE